MFSVNTKYINYFLLRKIDIFIRINNILPAKQCLCDS